MLTLTVFLFGLSYAMRYVWDAFFNARLYKHSYFSYYVYYDLLCLFEGGAFMALLLMHRFNFRVRNVKLSPQ